MSDKLDLNAAKEAAKEPAKEFKTEKPPVDPVQSDQADDPVMTEQVTYLPGPEDPPQTRLSGHHFHANLPKKVQMKKSWFDALRTNKWYKVGEFNPERDAVAAQEEPDKPITADQYKAHAVSWFKTTQSLHEFDEKWMAEESLRQECDVGGSDLDYLISLARPKRYELEKKLRP